MRSMVHRPPHRWIHLLRRSIQLPPQSLLHPMPSSLSQLVPHHSLHQLMRFLMHSLIQGVRRVLGSR